MSGSGKQFVNQLKEKELVQTIFRVADKFVLKDKKGNDYLSLNLSDKSGTINCRLWDNVDKVQGLFEAGDFIFVKGHVQLYQNKRQVVIHEIRPTQTGDYELGDFFDATEQSGEELFKELKVFVEMVKDPHLKQLITIVLDDPEIQPRLLQSPAAKTIHHAYVGGLLEHIVSICGLMKKLGQHYSFLNLDFLLFGAIFHDIGKVWEIEIKDGFQYTDCGRLIGHISLGCELIDEKVKDIPGFPQRLKELCKHLVLSHHNRLEYGSPKRPQFLEALVVAMIDDLDSQLNTLLYFMKGEVQEKGSWTRYHQNYDRYFYLDVLRDQLFEEGS